MGENKDINRKLEDVEVDIEATMKNTILSRCLDDCYYVSPLKDNKVPITITELLGLSFDDIVPLDQKFFSQVYESLDNEGIYIALAFVERKTDNEFLIKSGDKEKLVFIDSPFEDVLKQEFGTLDFDNADFGIKITENEISYGIRHPGDSMPLSPPYFEEHDLNKDMMELIKGTVVFR